MPSKLSAQRHNTLKVLERNLSDNQMLSIKKLSGHDDKQAILHWCATGEGLTPWQRLVVGAITGLDSASITAGSEPESSDIYCDYTNCHWGHVGLRIDGTMRWYPISVSERENIAENLYNDATRLTFNTQDDRRVVVPLAEKLEEIVFLDEAQEWPDHEEWVSGGGYAGTPASPDFWKMASLWTAKNVGDLSEEIFEELVQRFGDPYDGDYAAKRDVVVMASTTWTMTLDNEDLHEAFESIQQGFDYIKFRDHDAERFVPTRMLKLVEFPRARLEMNKKGSEDED